jgi:hypothetical protein
VDVITPTVKQVTVAPDRKSLRLVLEPMVQGDIYELHLDGVKNEQGEPLLHGVGYYTLNEIPKP